MKLVVEHADLARAVADAVAVVDTSSKISILSMVRLDAEGGSLSIWANTMTVELVGTIGAEIEEEGSVCVSAARLSHVVKSAPDGSQIALNLTKTKRMTAKTQRRRFELATLPAQDFPRFTRDPDEGSFYMQAAALVRLLAHTEPATREDVTRAYLSGVFLHAGSGRLHAGATDGHLMLLAVNELGSTPALPEHREDAKGVIVPAKACAMIRKVFAQAGEVRISASATVISVEADGRRLSSKLVAGTYPDLDRLVPKESAGSIVFYRKDLQQALAAVAPFGEGAENRGSVVFFVISAGRVVLLASSAEGMANEILAAQIDGEPISFAVNHRLLTTALQIADREQMRLSLNPEVNGAMLLTEEPADGEGAAASLLAVVMPRRETIPKLPEDVEQALAGGDG